MLKTRRIPEAAKHLCAILFSPLKLFPDPRHQPPDLKQLKSQAPPRTITTLVLARGMWTIPRLRNTYYRNHHLLQ